MEHLKAWLAEPTEPTQYRKELALKLTAGEHASPATFISHLESYRDTIIRQQKALAAMQANIDAAHPEGMRKMYLNMAYDYTELTLAAKLAWCEKSLKALQL